MQVIEALFIRVEEPHDYLHIKHERARLAAALLRWLVPGLRARLER